MTNLPYHPTMRHPLTGEPLRAIYRTKRGKLVWPQMGGDDTVVPAAPVDPAPQQSPTPQSGTAEPAADTAAEDAAAQALLAAAAKLGDPADPMSTDAGKRALATERQRAKAAEDAAKAYQKQLADMQTQLEALKPAADVFAQIRKAAVPEAEKTDLEKLAERLAAQEQATEKERIARVRLEVIQDKKLTKAHAEWLKGTTYDEMAASADALLALFPKPADPPPVDPAPVAPVVPGPVEPEPAKAKAPAPKPDPSQGAKGKPGVTRSASLSAAIANAYTPTT